MNPIGKCVVVRPLDREITTANGVVIPDTGWHYRVGEVVSVGPKSGLLLSEPGDIIYYNLQRNDLYEGMALVMPGEVICVQKKDGTLVPPDGAILVWSEETKKDDEESEGGIKTLSFASWNNYATSRTKAEVVGVPQTRGGRFEVGDSAHFSPQLMLRAGNDAYVGGRRVWRLNCGGTFDTDVFGREREGKLYPEFGLLFMEMDEKPTTTIETSLFIPESTKQKEKSIGTVVYATSDHLVGQKVVVDTKKPFPFDFGSFGKFMVVEEEFVHGIYEQDI